ncbi:ArsR family transcriptional regulator [Streptomyces sp. NPDC097619]|uniref:ArsR/SmtB family transcription factor n=1 Tax=Streptomyces sp. NPDC097619 TaxID=3157228 RepID=UPI00331818F5
MAGAGCGTTEVRLGAADLAQLRFAISPLWEAVAALRATTDPGRHALHLPWLKEASALGTERTALLPHLPELEARLPAPRCPLATLDEELAELAEPAEPPAPEGPEGTTADAVGAAGAATSAAVRGWWRAGVEPYWPRIRAVLEADLAHRTRQSAEDGIQEVLARLHPDLDWSAGRLRLPAGAAGPVARPAPAAAGAAAGPGLTLAPSAFAPRCLLVPGRPGVPPCLVYPARGLGTLWERPADTAEGLARLLGRSRARLLADTVTPSTTTGLAERTGLTAGAVSQHLAVLGAAGLVTRHRYGREVYYRAADLGLALLGGAHPPRGASSAS